MLSRFLVLCLPTLAFFIGYYYDRPDDNELTAALKQIEQLKQHNAQLKQRNIQVEETLDLVKRQIQTDRMAYQAMREAVLQQLHAQRALLDRLKKQLAE